MKTFFLLLLMSFSAYSAECKLTGILESSQKLQTSLGVKDFEECKRMGSKSLRDNFFGLASSEDRLIEMNISFRDESGTQTEVLSN